MLSFLIWQTLASNAWAAGFFYPDSGIVANGRGCAFVAGADNQFAQYYNPAGLTRMKYTTLNVGTSAVKQFVTFEPVDAMGQLGPPVENEGQWFLIPEFGIAGPINDKFAYAFGMTSGFAPDYNYPEDGPQRYSMIDAQIYNFQIGPSFAYRPIPQVSFGVGLQWQVLQVGQQLNVTTTGQSDPTGDVLVNASVKDMFTPSFNAGVIVEPIPAVSIGASVQPPIRFNARGDGLLDFTGHSFEPLLRQSQWTDDDIGLDLQMPLFVRTGVAVRPVPALELEADFVWEGWSALEDIIVSDVDVTVEGGCDDQGSNCLISQPVESTLALPAGFGNAWSVRLGGELELGNVDVRLGGMYETASLSPQQISVAVVDTPKIQLGTGASVHLLKNRLVLDSYAFSDPLPLAEIRDSQVSQINVFDPTQFQTVGNGDLRSLGLAFGLGLRWQFGADEAT